MFVLPNPNGSAQQRNSVFAGTRYRQMLSESRLLNHLLLKVKDYERAKPTDEYIKPFRCLRLCTIDLKQCRCGWRRKPIEPTGPVAMTYSSQEKGFALITLAIVNFPWTGRVCQGKQHNKERMNGGMKERKCWSPGRSGWQSAGTRSWKLVHVNALTAAH